MKPLSQLKQEIEKHQKSIPPVTVREVELLEKYLDILTEWNAKISLVSRSSFDKVFPAHIADSLWVSELARPWAGSSVGDIGSGAGLPGVVFAIRYPDVKVTLFEKMAKRQAYLDDLLKRLALPNVRWAPGLEKPFAADFFFARAVLPPTELLGWLAELLRAPQRIALNLGSTPKDYTVPNVFKSIAHKDYTLPGNEGARQIVIYERVPRGT